FDILAKDHHDIDGRLAGFVDAANAVIRHADDRDRLHSVAGAFRADLNTLERLLDRHLIDEEELVVPVILKYGAPNFD
ncbi:MAG: hemerythrin domain-containing protein, partial [Pseudomonadota bacterium]